MNNGAWPSARVWWILRKDIARLWPLAGTFVGLQTLLSALRYQSQPFGPSGGRLALIPVVEFTVAVTLVLLVVLIVQQDPIPGSDQDWIARPVRRVDLLFAKILGIVAMTLVPGVLASTTLGLVEGFGLGQAVAWVLRSFSLLLTVLASVGAVLLAYLGRRIVAARAVLCLSIVVAVSALFSPWQVGYAVEQWLSPVAATRAISLAFALGPTPVRAQRSRPWTSLLLRVNPRYAVSFPTGLLRNIGESVVPPTDVRIVLPFRVAGLPAVTLIHGDDVAVRITGPRGGVYRGTAWDLICRRAAPAPWPRLERQSMFHEPYTTGSHTDARACRSHLP